jgi:Pyruvate/2-oxoacid:ferredoxin oxidoreductase gamma subunit
MLDLHQILLRNAENNVFIEKAIGKIYEKNLMREKATYATVRYLIENRIYSLDQNLSKDDLKSPKVTIRDTHLVFGLDPYETFKNLKFYSEKTLILLNVHKLDYPFSKSALRKRIVLPSIGCIIDTLDQLVRKVVAVDMYDVAKSMFQSEEYINMIMLGLAAKEFREIFSKKRLIGILSETENHQSKRVAAFQYGYDLIND